MTRTVIEHGVRVRHRDGTELVCDVYRRDGGGPAPTLVRRTPYGRVGRVPYASADPLRMVTAGYNLVVQDTRGRGESSGAFRPFDFEADDGADLVTWVSEQPWSDGRVGAWGRSYEGFAQWATPGLTAVAPTMSTGRLHEVWFHPGGVFQLGFAVHWALGDLTGATHPGVDTALDSIECLYRDPASALALLDGPAPYVRDWLAHPEWDPYWRCREPAGSAPNTLVVSGWHDVFVDGALEDHWRAVAAHPGGVHRLVVGPWSHCVDGGVFPEREYGTASGADHVDVAGRHLEFFDDAFARRGRGGPDATMVDLFVTGRDRWVRYDRWPPHGVVEQRLHLRGAGRANGPHAAGGLTTQPAGDEPPDRFVFRADDPVPTCGGRTLMSGMQVGSDCGPRDQRTVECRPDVLTYTSAPLERELTVIGTVELQLFASAAAAGADFTAKLVDVHPSGRAEIICDGVRRAGLGRDRNGVWALRVRVGACANAFVPGHRVRLEVSSSNFPRFLPRVGPEPLADPRDAEPVLHTIHHSRRYPSALVLPLLTDTER